MTNFKAQIVFAVVGLFFLVLSSSCSSVDRSISWAPFQCLGEAKGKVPFKVGLDQFEDKRTVSSKRRGRRNSGIIVRGGARYSKMMEYHEMLRAEELDKNPLMGPLDMHLTNEFLYNFIRTGLFEDVKRWYEPDDVDLIVRCEIRSFSVLYRNYVLGDMTKGFWFLLPLGIPYGKKEVDIHLVFHLLDPSTGKEIGNYEGKRNKAKYHNMYVSPDKLEDRLVKEIFDDFASEFIRLGPTLSKNISSSHRMSR